MASTTLYDQVFHGRIPETYEEFCDRAHEPFEAIATFESYCAAVRPDLGPEDRAALWRRYAKAGFSVVLECGATKPLPAR